MSAAVARTADELYADSLRAGTERFRAQVEAAQRQARIERLSQPPRAPSLAMQAATADMQGHARRWVQARRDTLLKTGSDAAPCRDVRLDLAGNHALVAGQKARLP